MVKGIGKIGTVKPTGFAPRKQPPLPKWGGCDLPSQGGIGGNLNRKYPIGGCDTPDTGGIGGNIGKNLQYGLNILVLNN